MIESADDTKIFEHEQGPVAGGDGQGAVGYDSDACPRPVVDILFTDSFRGGNGTQVRWFFILYLSLFLGGHSCGRGQGASAGAGDWR